MAKRDGKFARINLMIPRENVVARTKEEEEEFVCGVGAQIGHH